MPTIHNDKSKNDANRICDTFALITGRRVSKTSSEERK